MRSAPRWALVAAIAAWLCLIGACDQGPSYEEGVRQGYRHGYGRGARDMAEEVKRQAVEARRTLRGPMRGRLMVLAVVAAMATLFGAKWADALRQWLAARFKVPLPAQAWIATGLYLAAAGGLMWYALAKCGGWESVPVAILVAGSLLPFLDYRAALLAGDAQRRRAAFAKCKSLLILALVVVIIMLILSDRGFLGIQIGRGHPPPVFFFSPPSGLSRTACSSLLH